MRIFSGIQPTGRKHLGNYLGAIRQYVAGQDRGESIYCIVDLHATTVPYEPDELPRAVLDTTALLMAAGLDPERCILFRQSDVKEHTELAWMLSTVTAYGELSRMHQFKEKSRHQRDFVSAGLFTYPILQAADILAYTADEVPVGEDQAQHLELARDIARRFNSRYGETFVVPEHRTPQIAARVMDLQAPDKKMSTTAGTELGTVLILDEPDEIRRKFAVAVTDSGRDIVRQGDKPGVTNLIEIVAAVRGTDPDEVEREYAGASGYAGFKRDVGEAVIELLTPIRQRYRSSGPTRRRSASYSRRALSGHVRSRRQRSPWRGSAWASAPARSAPETLGLQLRHVAHPLVANLGASPGIPSVVASSTPWSNSPAASSCTKAGQRQLPRAVSTMALAVDLRRSEIGEIRSERRHPSPKPRSDRGFLPAPRPRVPGGCGKRGRKCAATPASVGHESTEHAAGAETGTGAFPA